MSADHDVGDNDRRIGIAQMLALRMALMSANSASLLMLRRCGLLGPLSVWHCFHWRKPLALTSSCPHTGEIRSVAPPTLLDLIRF